jgi:hypothetical protein
MPASILNSELGHARERQELHTHAESGPFAFTTGPAMTGQQISRRQRGLKQTSEAEQKPKSEAQKKASQAKNAAKKANIAAMKAKAAADQPIPATVAMSASLVVQNYANQNHLGQYTELAHKQTTPAHKQMPPAQKTSTTQKANAGKKKKKRPRKKHELPDDAQNLVYGKDQVHRDNLIKLLHESNTRQEYAKALHVEFVRYAQDIVNFLTRLLYNVLSGSC